jgi:hypothetical protein
MITKIEYGTWKECMGIVRRSKMKARDPNKRIFDRYDIVLLFPNVNPKLEKYVLTLYKGE